MNAQPGGSNDAAGSEWFKVEGQWIDPLGFASLLSGVLWDTYGRELKANWQPHVSGQADGIDAYLEAERQRRASRWLA